MLGQRDDNATPPASKCTYDSSIKAIAQTYCVFEPSVCNSQEKCEAAGWTWTTKCETPRTTTALERVKGATNADKENECKAAGLTWDGSLKRCLNKYNITNINTISDETQKAAICKAAGYKWSKSAGSPPTWTCSE